MRYHLQKRGDGESPVIRVRVAPETLRALDAKARALGLTRSDLVREVLFMTFSTPDEIKERLAKERAISAWIRHGCPDPDPTAEFDH